MTTTQIPDYVDDDFLRALRFRSGKGSGREGDRCSIQEYRAWIGLDPASDAIPEGDSRVVGRYIIGFQDRLKNAGATDAQMYELVGRHLPKLRGSYGSAALETRRAFLLADMLVRDLAPMWFELTPELATWAEQLRALAAIVDTKTNETARVVYDRARSAAWDARQKGLGTLRAKIEAELLTRAKPEGLSDRVWKRAVAVAEAAVAVAEAAVEAAEAEAAEAAVAEAVAEAAEAVAAAAAEAAVAVAAARRPGESDDAYFDRIYWDVRAAVREAIWDKTKESLLSMHRERIERSWALGGRFIEQALAMTEAA